MNFDVNTLSTLMQLMNSQRPKEPETPPSQNVGGDGYNSSAYRENGYASQSQSEPMPQQSLFAMQNGLGQRIDLSPKQEKRQTAQPSSNPMSSLFDMMAGKSSGGGDALTSFMPMLMNMLGANKNAQVAQNNASNQQRGSNKLSSFEQKLKEAKEKADSAQSSHETNASNKDSGEQAKKHTSIKNSLDRYEPITFAGYTLISSLNKLFIAKKHEAGLARK